MTTYRRIPAVYQVVEYTRGVNEQAVLDWISALPQLSGQPRDPDAYFAIGQDGQLLTKPGSSTPNDFTAADPNAVWTIAINLISPIGMCIETYQGPITDWAANYETVTVDSTGLHIT